MLKKKLFVLRHAYYLSLWLMEINENEANRVAIERNRGKIRIFSLFC